jgi:hypothetical protein
MSIRSRLAAVFVVPLLAFTLAFSSRAQSSKLPEVSKFRLPGKNWVLQIKTDGFALEQSQTADDGFGRMIMASNPATGVLMSVYMEKAPHKGGSRDARQYYWERSKGSPVKKDGIKLSENSVICRSSSIS